jgi:hypothetical protein
MTLFDILRGKPYPKYRPLIGDYRGQVGEVVRRFSDPSYDTIGLMFSDGVERGYEMREVERVVEPDALASALDNTQEHEVNSPQ